MVCWFHLMSTPPTWKRQPGRPRTKWTNQLRGDNNNEVRGVDGSCAKHLTVESYMVIYALAAILIIISFSSPTLSFIPDLKPSFSANPFRCSLSFSSAGLTTRFPDFYGYF